MKNLKHLGVLTAVLFFITACLPERTVKTFSVQKPYSIEITSKGNLYQAENFSKKLSDKDLDVYIVEHYDSLDMKSEGFYILFGSVAQHDSVKALKKLLSEELTLQGFDLNIAEYQDFKNAVFHYVPGKRIFSGKDEIGYEVHFIDVGQGDAVLVTTPKKNLLVDGGKRNSGVVGYLDSLEIDKIDIVIGTHPHADHIGGLIEVLSTFDIGKVIDPGITHTTVTYNDYMEAIDSNEINYKVGKKGLKKQLSADAYIKLLHPTSPDSRHLNNASVVAKVTLGDVVVILTGDVEKEGEQEMLEYTGLLPGDVLKVGHHCSRTSSTMEFLEAVMPEVSIVMCGEGNRYGHPHSEVLERLEMINSTIFRTDLDGHIVIKSNGEEFYVVDKEEHELISRLNYLNDK